CKVARDHEPEWRLGGAWTSARCQRSTHRDGPCPRTSTARGRIWGGRNLRRLWPGRRCHREGFLTMLGFVDETFRDGPQSLWATRMNTASMLVAAQWSNEAGFRKVCVTSGAAVETAVRFLHDDPWERIRL